MELNHNEIYYNKGNNGYKLYHLKTEHGGGTTAKYLHIEGELMIIYFIQGSGNIKIEGKQYDINRGDIIMINPNELFQLNVDDDKFHERIILHPNETLLKYFPGNNNSIFMSFYKRKKGENNRIPAKIVKEYHIDKDLITLLEIAESGDSTSLILSICKIVELLVKLGKVILPMHIVDKEHVHENQLITDVIKYIKLHLGQNITVESIAAHFNLGKSYLSHVFREQVGMSLWNYVILRRICMFNYLIKDSNSIEDTCYKVGFQNYSNFFRLYKKHMNMTPTEFKKQISKN